MLVWLMILTNYIPYLIFFDNTTGLELNLTGFGLNCWNLNIL